MSCRLFPWSDASVADSRRGAAAVGAAQGYQRAGRLAPGFGTLTTVGHGDLTTSNGLARALANIEAPIGQLDLVTVLSLFVSNLRPRRQRADA